VLEELRISDLGVIDDAVLELAPGLTVVTGETGAGKTMVVTGLGLLFGARSDVALVRSGSTRTAIDGRLRVSTKGRVAGLLDELDIEVALRKEAKLLRHDQRRAVGEGDEAELDRAAAGRFGRR